MKWFYNIKIFGKLIIGFSSVAIIAGLIGFIGIYQITTLQKNDKQLYENMTLPISYMSKIAVDFQQLRIDTRDLILANDDTEITALVGSINEKVLQVTKNSEEFEKTISSNDVKSEFLKFEASVKAFTPYLDEFILLSRDNLDNEANVLLKSNKMTQAVDNEQAAIEKLLSMKIEQAKNMADSNTKTANTATLFMSIIAICGMVLAVVAGIFIARFISKPVKKLSKAAELIADGDLNINLDIKTKDEVGILAKSFIRMADNLNDTMSNISTASGQVASGSKQVSDSSLALSQGATEQASSIEQLTASIEEVSTQTKLNAENANQANSIAEAAKVNAVQGNSHMKEMLVAMEEINDSSSNINKIIKVIDEIAFQTNILALNAAVEAARAGQHGRGFAVVAEEVRNLAARSSNAAKETSAMIEGSIKKSEVGTKIANETAEALNKIVDAVSQVAVLVGDIAVASNEQASGIAQINQGILQVSEVVQTNSATSEESAAASEELAGQAEMLKSQVEKFSLRTSESVIKEEVKTNVTEKSKKKKKLNKLNKLYEKVANTKKIALSDKEFGDF